jgi:isoquinoline 1-oxidoreductase alpha subunit
MVTTVRINGQPRTVDADPDTPLLWVIRDELKLTGTKFGCGAGLCGACTVHVKGVAQKSCQISLKDAAAMDITTIEGVKSRTIDAVRRAWVELDVAQCGYCQSGQIMAATALLAKTKKPTEAQIVEAMDANICRCASYARIRAAVKRASEIV